MECRSKAEIQEDSENKAADNTAFYFLTLLLVILVTVSLFSSELLNLLFLELF
jgi:hypothetical protein